MLRRSSRKNSAINTTNSNVTALQNTVAGKQDKLTFDSTPTSGSSNPVTSGGVYAAINSVGGLNWVETDIDSLQQNDVVQMRGRLTSTAGDGYKDVALFGIFLGVSSQRYIIGATGAYDSTTFRLGYITKFGTNLLKLFIYYDTSSSATLPASNTWTSDYKFYVLK